MSTDHEVAVAGGGVAGLTAALYTARHGLSTVVFDAGGSILRRNAHLENYPGFPGGVDARRLLSMTREQVERAGATVRDRRVTRLAVREDRSGADGDEPASERVGDPSTAETDDPDATGGGFAVETDAGVTHADRVVIATKNAVSFLPEAVSVRDRGKAFVETDDRGRTGVPGLYAAGRLAGKPHQAVVAAGHGAEVAVTLLEDADVGFYHDWVTPEGYFTGRDRPVPPGCEELDEATRRDRERAGRRRLREHLEAPPDPPEQHPDVDRGA